MTAPPSPAWSIASCRRASLSGAPVLSRDRRARELEITDEGRRTLRKITPAVESAQAIMLRGLSAKEGEDLMRLLRKAIAAGNELSRAPLREA